MFSFLKKRNYVDWPDYKERIDFLELFHWQQAVRKENIKNITF
jgi:hypothetical protein